MLDLALAGGQKEILRSVSLLAEGLDSDDVVGSAEEAHARTLVETTERPANRLVGWADLGAPTVTVMVPPFPMGFFWESMTTTPRKTSSARATTCSTLV